MTFYSEIGNWHFITLDVIIPVTQVLVMQPLLFLLFINELTSAVKIANSTNVVGLWNGKTINSDTRVELQ